MHIPYEVMHTLTDLSARRQPIGWPHTIHCRGVHAAFCRQLP
jgi:hypothetical protein